MRRDFADSSPAFPLWLALGAAAGLIPAATASDRAAEMAFFETKIRPVLAEQCYSCHSAGAEKLRAGLQVDHREHLLAGGETGPAFVAGLPEESLLLESLRYGNPNLQMPPKSKLPDAVVADFEKWIALGAPWPEEAAPLREAGGVRVDGSDAVMEPFDLAKRRAEHWSWQPVAPGDPPAVKDALWPESDLDRFLLARLEAAGLAPAEEAAPEVWLRRAHFDLIGLPPAPSAIDSFLAEWRADPARARSAAVDALLASPHFGERWARHWMDLARYGETCGHEFDYPIPHAWRYRDYLIDAFNRDLPWDQFLIEHLAGDLLERPRRDPATGVDQSIQATGFWFLHEAVHAPTDIRGDEAARIDNQIDVFTKSFLALTVSCARCHDHKFDAISTADYYALAGYLVSSRRQEAFLDPGDAVAAAAASARAIHARGDALLPRAFGSSGENAAAAGRFARTLLAADRLLAEQAREDTADPGSVVFEDFEDGYGDWEIEGEAFGQAPASGTFPGQQAVSGFLGQGLVNTWNGTDRHTGRALSPEFVIGHPFIHFLIGGGSHAGETCVNLLVEGKPLFTATGKNQEKLEPHAWDVSAHLGQRARIEIVDAATGGWGHVNVDHIVFSGRPDFAGATGAASPLDPALARRVAGEEGGLDPQLLARWAELLRGEAVDDPGHPLHPWIAGAWDPAARQRLAGQLSRQDDAHAAARGAAEPLAAFAPGEAGGWTITGHAFDAAPRHRPSWAPGAGGALLSPAGTLGTAALPEGFRGVLRSPGFRLSGAHIHLRMRARSAQVRLVIDGHHMNVFHQLLLRGTLLKPDATDTGGEFRWLTMQGDLDKYLGHRAWLEISDSAGGHVEVAEILVSDAPLPPPASGFARALLEDTAGDTREALAAAYGQAWASSLEALAAGAPGEAESALLELAWKEQLWPRDPGLLAAAAELESLPVPQPELALALLEGTPEDERVHIRGSHQALGDLVPRRNLEALGGAPAPAHASGRLELARELASPDNPLVSRVAVNRVWHHLFGRGLAPSVDDFGVMGQAPSHPELLDWLAAEFAGPMGWSVKSLAREIVLSRAYRMSSAPRPGLDPARLAEADPDNVLLHRAPVRRLQAEAIRDAMLAVSGRLDPAVGGDSVPVHLTAFMEGRGRPGQTGPLDGDGRRSLYTAIRRNFLPPFLLAFDMPIPFNAMGRRSASNVPAQALSLMNDPFVAGQARLWAESIGADASMSQDEKVAHLFRAAFGRPPEDAERVQIASFLASATAASGPGQAWTDLCHALFNKKEFIYLN